MITLVGCNLDNPYLLILQGVKPPFRHPLQNECVFVGIIFETFFEEC